MFGKNEQPADAKFFIIYDAKIGGYRKNPIMADDAVDAIRSYESIVRNNPDDQLVSNAEDFQLFSIGQYSRKSGEIQSWKPVHIANLHEIKAAVLNKQQVGMTST